jgi:hypothetical protein
LYLARRTGAGPRNAAISGDRVENLWTFGANPVENLTTQIFLCADRARYGRIADVDAIFVRAFA